MQMSEKEAIQALMDELDGVEAEPQAQETPKAEGDEEPTQEPSNSEIMQKLEQIEAKKEPEIKDEPKKEAPVDDELEKVRAEMGLAGIKEKIDEQQAFIEQQKAKMQEQAQMLEYQKTFNDIETKLKEEFPLIKPDELVEFANKNGYFESGAMNPLNLTSWKMVAELMTKRAAVQESPDTIISSSGNTTSVGAFDKLNKGENVSDIELGAELLKLAGGQ